VSGGRLLGRGKGGSKQTSVATSRPLFTICTKRRCWYLVAPEPFGDGVRDLGECSGRGLKKSVARTYGYSGRTWTPLILPVLGGGGVERKAGWPGFPHNGKERARTRGESGMAGVPSQWEGTGRDKGEKGNGRGSLTMGRNGPGQGEKAGWPGFPHNGKERGRDKRRKAGCSEVGSGVGVGGCIGSRTGTGIGIMSSAGSARYFC
jgi:hypothetical protein